MYMRLATRLIALDSDKMRTLVTNDRAVNDQYYWWEMSGVAEL